MLSKFASAELPKNLRDKCTLKELTEIGTKLAKKGFIREIAECSKFSLLAISLPAAVWVYNFFNQMGSDKKQDA